MSEPTGRLLRLLQAEPDERTVTVDREALRSLHAELGFATDFEDFELVVLHAAAAAVNVEPFALRVGQWRIDMPQRLLQSAIATAVLVAAIAADGVSGVPVLVLAVVLPFLVDIERIELRGRDRIVLMTLRNLGVEGGDPAPAYRLLPVDLQTQLTLLEFADVWDRLVAAGAMDPDAHTPDALPHKVALSLPAEPKDADDE